MPELPEVEIVKQSLNKNIKYKKIIKVTVRNRNLRFKIPRNFETYLENKNITKITRFSKYIIIHLSSKSFCIIHLGMSGTIHLIKNNKKKKFTNLSFYHSLKLPKKHNHIEIKFEKCTIIYNDPRRFGFFELIKNQEQLNKRFIKFGPEPFSNLFCLSYVRNYFKNKKKDIKNFLLDQKFVSGIGNIYASEILFQSKIDPTKKGKLMTENNCKKIVINSRKVLLSAINKGGSSIRDFKNISGTKGTFQKNFKVYQRENLSCKRQKCRGIIQKKNLSNRATFFCNTCQK